MKKIKRNTTSFNLAFLDIMFCGFGAVVLLVLIINSHIMSDNKAINENLTAEVDRVVEKITEAKLYQKKIEDSLEEKKFEIKKLNDELIKVNSERFRLNNKKIENEKETQDLKEHINRLQTDIRSLDKTNNEKVEQYKLYRKQSGDKVRSI